MKVKREDFTTEAEYVAALEALVNKKPKAIVKTFSFPSGTMERMEKVCELYKIKKSHFIVSAIKEKLKAYE